MNICTKNLTRRGVKDFKVQGSKSKFKILRKGGPELNQFNLPTLILYIKEGEE